jgi:hypothetical protein
LKRLGRNFVYLAAGVIILALTGCKSNWIEADVQNLTLEPVHELEVAYPSASFGANTLAPGADYRYRFQVRDSGPVRVEFVLPDGKSVHAQGLNLNEQDQGQLTIRLLPQGKVEFLPRWSVSHIGK